MFSTDKQSTFYNYNFNIFNQINNTYQYFILLFNLQNLVAFKAGHVKSLSFRLQKKKIWNIQRRDTLYPFTSKVRSTLSGVYINSRINILYTAAYQSLLLHSFFFSDFHPLFFPGDFHPLFFPGNPAGNTFHVLGWQFPFSYCIYERVALQP